MLPLWTERSPEPDATGHFSLPPLPSLPSRCPTSWADWLTPNFKGGHSDTQQGADVLISVCLEDWRNGVGPGSPKICIKTPSWWDFWTPNPPSTFFFLQRRIRLQLRSAPISSADCYIRFPHTTVFFFSGSGAIFNWCCELKIALHPRETRSGAGIAWHPWMIGEGGTFKTATAPRWALWEADASIEVGGFGSWWCDCGALPPPSPGVCWVMMEDCSPVQILLITQWIIFFNWLSIYQQLGRSLQSV